MKTEDIYIGKTRYQVTHQNRELVSVRRRVILDEATGNHEWERLFLDSPEAKKVRDKLA